ncbi:MAG: phosphoribosyltransferase family protein [Pseudomonadota bacterium]
MRTVFDTEQIEARLSVLADEVVSDLGPNFTMVPILTGGFVFAADLARALYRAKADPEIDFIQLSSYGAGRVSSGDVQLVKDVTASVEDQTILLVDDVLDSGRSISFVRDLFAGRGARRIVTCVAVDKTYITDRGFSAEHSLFDMTESAYLVGYGMDDAGALRGLPTISALQD